MNRFKNASGVYYTKALFYELTGIDKSTVLFTLKNEDHLGLPSLYRLYMEAGDPTEYRFAVSALDGYAHWKVLCDCSWFKEYATDWRYELELRLRSEALASILEVSKDKHSPNSYHANKYLLDGSWKPAGEKKAGRPTKEAIQREAHQIASNREREATDFERILGKAN